MRRVYIVTGETLLTDGTVHEPVMIRVAGVIGRGVSHSLPNLQ